jgi:zinc transporter ZupT
MVTLLTLYVVLILTVLASGSFIFFIRQDDQRILKLLLAFSGAFLIGISFMKLIPEVFSSRVKYVGLFVMLGFLIQLVLELITEGAEHGHKQNHSDGERVSPFLLLIGLCIHSFPIVGAFRTGIQHTLVIGIVIHNIPISLTLMSLFLHYGLSKQKAIGCLVIFSFMTPLGSIVSNLISHFSSASIDIYFNYIMAVVIGIFLHVSTSILFETEENHKYNLQKFLTVCVGILVAFGLSLI